VCLHGTCSFPAPIYRLPLGGVQGADWAITSYFDADRVSGSWHDYTGGTRTYDGHEGTDFAPYGGWEAMDRGVPIYAIEGGIVQAVHDGEYDRQVVADPHACGIPANRVEVIGDDWRLGLYLHLRSGSIPSAVVEGARVEVGAVLGQVGSSGCSGGPHLHLEVREGGTSIDSVGRGMFAAPPAYR
jgi:murein DD-endopeptidase MepM/ murein hydrolase activator NlpD